MTETERAQRGRRFLELLRRAPDSQDSSEASEALYLLLHYEVEPGQISDHLCAALDRMLVTWSREVIEGTMRDLGVDEITLKLGE
jgi:hypothetical protein